ncbi:hypothetical protein PYW08_000709 [Mythimna loreyi]|uniref:Uncharacterized protein n=1 Tax=Mythimna loreyi TaxID=667449 RepID=A0ACC2R2K4_9NEOP|nr:hypothetical protein PYW08_000709 [Mythimna loreyi]
MSRKCVNSADNFCYICGKVTLTNQRCSITQRLETAYFHYFGIKIKNQDKSWVPHFSCTTCSTNLIKWLNKKKRSLPFGVPMVWREPTNHANDCYFCLTPPIQHGISRKKKRSVVYPDVASVSRPVPHGINLPVPRPPEEYQQDSEEAIHSMEVDYNEPTTSQSSQFIFFTLILIFSLLTAVM